MGTSRSPAELAAKFRAAGTAIEEASKEGVRAAALEVTQSVRRTVAAASGGDSRLSGVGKRGAKVGAGFDVKGTRNPTAVVQARGPLHLIERSTKPHAITPKKRNKTRAIQTPEGPRASAQHPGTRGKHPFERGVALASPRVPRVFQAAVRRNLMRVFK